MIPFRDYFQEINRKTRETWKEQWRNDTRPNKLKIIKPELKKWSTSYHKTRYKETTLARLRIGHTNITHRHLMERRPAPTCQTCNMPLTVQHILTRCTKYIMERKKYFPEVLHMNIEQATKHMLDDDPDKIKSLFNFLSHTKLFELI